MKTQTKTRLLLLAVLVIAGSALTYLLAGGIEKNLVYYWDAKQLVDNKDKTKNAVIRLGGVVQKGSLVWDQNKNDLMFQVGLNPEAKGPAIRVHATGIPPQMFREGIGVVVEGRYDGETFHSDRLMVKHSNEYRAPKTGETPQDYYKTLLDKES